MPPCFTLSQFLAHMQRLELVARVQLAHYLQLPLGRDTQSIPLLTQPFTPPPTTLYTCLVQRLELVARVQLAHILPACSFCS
jgi:hypothetical protein